MIGQTLDNYRIESKLGEGGMGVVYKSRDTRLNRPVAIKVLPSETTAEPERKRRFVQEAKAASALNHPNICTIYELGEYEGRPFLVMELLEGQTLRQRIVGKPLKIDEVLELGFQLAAGHLGETKLVRTARAFQRVTGWHRQHPLN